MVSFGATNSLKETNMSLQAGYYRCTDEHDEVPRGQIVYAVQGESTNYRQLGVYSG